MRYEIYALTAIAVLLAVGEFLYILSLRKNIRKIAESFEEKRCMDSNTVVTISTVDRAVMELAANMNRELQALRKERLKLECGDRELQNAVTNIAHDLRTPLTAISGYLELLEDEIPEGKARRYYGVICERTEALRQLTEELFRYSVVSSTADRLQRTDVSLNAALEQALAGAYGMLTERNICPEIVITETEVVRKLDPAALQRILGNLLSNAAKYSDGDLCVALDSKGTITFSNKAVLTRVEVEKLFDRFYTVENAKGSTGLGLSIARLLTEKMGGSIRAEWDGGRLVIRLDFSK